MQQSQRPGQGIIVPLRNVLLSRKLYKKKRIKLKMGLWKISDKWCFNASLKQESSLEDFSRDRSALFVLTLHRQQPILQPTLLKWHKHLLMNLRKELLKVLRAWMRLSARSRPLFKKKYLRPRTNNAKIYLINSLPKSAKMAINRAKMTPFPGALARSRLPRPQLLMRESLLDLMTLLRILTSLPEY